MGCVRITSKMKISRRSSWFPSTKAACGPSLGRWPRSAGVADRIMRERSSPEPRRPGRGHRGKRPMGMTGEGRPERITELRPGVGPTHSTVEAPEGNEGVERRGRPGRIPLEEGGQGPDAGSGRLAAEPPAGEPRQRGETGRLGSRYCCITSMRWRSRGRSAPAKRRECRSRRGDRGQLRKGPG